MSDISALPDGLKCRWTFKFQKSTLYFESAAELMKSPSVQKRIQQATAKGLSYEIAQTFTKERTSWPVVLIIDRSVDPNAWIDHPTRCLHWTDSCGSRSVFWWGPIHSEDYDRAEDLPFDVFEQIAARVAKRKRPVLCLRREDPGLGIFIPELDRPSIDS